MDFVPSFFYFYAEMKVAEKIAHVDGEGNLTVNFSVNMGKDFCNRDVKISLLADDSIPDELNEAAWNTFLSKNPALSFLEEEPEVYTASHDKPYHR
jgi:hypothetical protein